MTKINTGNVQRVADLKTCVDKEKEFLCMVEAASDPLTQRRLFSDLRADEARNLLIRYEKQLAPILAGLAKQRLLSLEKKLSCFFPEEDGDDE